MPRLVKTQTQFEGRFEETWTLVEDADELPPWDGGRRARRSSARRAAPGRRAPRRPARPASRSTSSCRACSTRPCCARRMPHARLVALDLDAARAVPGVRAVRRAGRPSLVARPGGRSSAPRRSTSAQPVAAVAADTDAAAAAGLRALGAAFEALPFSISVDEAIAEQRFRGEPKEIVRGDVDAAMAARRRARSSSPWRRPATCRRRSSRTARSPGGRTTS